MLGGVQLERSLAKRGPGDPGGCWTCTSNVPWLQRRLMDLELQQTQYCQQIRRGDPFHLSTGMATPARLCPVLDTPVQEECEHTGEIPAKGPKNECETEHPYCERRLRVLEQPREKKAQGKSHQYLKDGAKRTQTGYFKWCLVAESETQHMLKHRMFPLNIRKCFFCCECDWAWAQALPREVVKTPTLEMEDIIQASWLWIIWKVRYYDFQGRLQTRTPWDSGNLASSEEEVEVLK